MKSFQWVEKEDFDKLQHALLIKMFISKLELEEIVLNRVKSFYEKLQITSYLTGEDFPHKIRNKARMYSFTASFQHFTGISS